MVYCYAVGLDVIFTFNQKGLLGLLGLLVRVSNTAYDLTLEESLQFIVDL